MKLSLTSGDFGKLGDLNIQDLEAEIIKARDTESKKDM